MRKLIFILVFLISSCLPPAEKAWIVLELSLPGEATKKMAFHNPGAPGATLEECKEALPMVIPELLGFVKSEARFAGAKLKNIKCVMAMGDPLKANKL